MCVCLCVCVKDICRESHYHIVCVSPSFSWIFKKTDLKQRHNFYVQILGLSYNQSGLGHGIRQSARTLDLTGLY